MRTLLSVLTFVLVGNLSALQQPEFVPGQAMLRFAAGSPGSEAVIRAGQASPPNLAELVHVIDELGARLSLPLRAVQVSSGNWLVLSVDSETLAERSAQRLRDRANVTDAQVRAREAGEAGGARTSLDIVVKFAPGSRGDKALARAWEGATAEPLADLLRDLEQELGVPLIAAARGRCELSLQVDLEALTLSLVDGLKALPEVESAQPNYVLRAFGPGAD